MMFSRVAAAFLLLGIASATTFCHNRRRGGPPTNSFQASNSFCQFTCPCCDAAAVSKAAQEPMTLSYTADGKALKMFVKNVTALASRRPAAKAAPSLGGRQQQKKLKSASVGDRWKKQGLPFKVLKKGAKLYDVADDDFHKTLLSDAASSHSLEEFCAEKYPDLADYIAEKQADEGWDDSEVAIWMYTTETPDVYRPMNAMLRTATSMDEIDEYWQSYISLLQTGLTTHASYADCETWRGVPCDASDALAVGDEGVLPSFTSTSTDHQVADNFGCDVLHFTGGGYDISKYSDFPGEAEVLMEEGRIYTVASAETDDDGHDQVDLTSDGPQAGKPDDIDPPDAEPAQDCTSVDQDTCPICQCCPPPEAGGDDDDDDDDAAASKSTALAEANPEEAGVMITAPLAAAMVMVAGAALAVAFGSRPQTPELAVESDEAGPALYEALPGQ